MLRRDRLFLVLLIWSVSLAGCGGVGLLIGGAPENFNKEYVGKLKTWNPQIKKISKEVCKSLDGRIDTMVSGADAFKCDMGTDMKSMAGNMNVTMGTGKMNMTAITARFDESNKKINFRVATAANYGVNVEKENEERMTAFKTKLQEALNQEISLEYIE